MNFKKTIFITFFILFIFNCFGNSPSEELLRINDSIQNVIKKEKDYILLRNNITDLLNRNYANNKPFVIDYIEKNILNNPTYTNDTLFYANTLNTYAICFLVSDVDRCIEIAKQGINYIGNNENPEILEKLALLNSNLANAYAIIGHNHTRLKVFADIHPIILKTKNPQIIRNYNHKLGTFYYEFNELDKSLEHLYKGIFIEEDFLYHPSFAGVTEIFIASVFLKKNQIDSVRKYIKISNGIKREELPAIFNARIKNLLGLSEAYVGDYSKSSELLDEAYQIALSNKDTSEILYNQFMQARTLVLQKQFSAAITKYNDVLSNNNEEFSHYRYYVLLSLIDAYKANGQSDKAFLTYDVLLKYMNEQKVKNQQLYAEELSYNMKFNEKIAEIERLKISNEKAEIKQQRNGTFIGGLAISLFLLLLILFLMLKAQKRNKMLAKKEYELLEAKLEEEKNSHLIDEMTLLKHVEDRERNRIATDLHDSIGGLLSSIKITLFNFQETSNLNPSHIEHTDRILEYIDETKQELNRIIYNLTPLIVEKFGLLEAIKQYCKKIQTDNFKIHLQIISVPVNINVQDEITLYRIIQEVLHNIVKHANAENVLLQVQTNFASGMVVISIEDDGEGMNVEDAKNKNGLGMRSLYSRVQSLNGSITIESEKGQGTMIYISCIPRKIEE